MKLGTNDKVIVADRIARKWVELALKGNAQAIEKIADRIDGKVVDKQALTDSRGNDLPMDKREIAVRLAALFVDARQPQAQVTVPLENQNKTLPD